MENILEENIFFENIDTDIKKYFESNKITQIDKNVVQILRHLMKLFFLFTNCKIQKKDNKKFETFFSDFKKGIIQLLLNNNYNPIEFKILKVGDFGNHSEYLSGLMKNLCYYLDKYTFQSKCINLYYYLFHLIYFILLSVTKSNKNKLEDDLIKFYLFHIVHFFKEEDRTPENYFFFYHGAFNLLKKRYQIPTEFIINFNTEKFFTMPNSVLNILRMHKMKLISLQNKSEKIQDNIGIFSKIYRNAIDIEQKVFDKKDSLYHNVKLNNVNNISNNGENLILLFEYFYESIKEILKILEKNGIDCPDLKTYYDCVNTFNNLIKKYDISINDLILMEMNYEYIPNKNKYEIDFNDDIEKYIYYAELCNKCKEDSSIDYTNSFKNIIESEKFKTLYSTAMRSSYIQKFVYKNNLSERYKIFMNEYIKKITDFILYVPLTRGIKAYVSNYLRIALNINSVEFLGDFDEESKKHFFNAYLLIQMLQESFHFIFKLNKDERITNNENSKSHKSKKIKECYEEIGVDLILDIFDTEYILFISKKNCNLICDPSSWEKEDTNFKVFNRVYLSNFELVDEKDKEKNLNSGLKFNISLGYDFIDPKEFKICTDSVIRYCY